MLVREYDFAVTILFSLMLGQTPEYRYDIKKKNKSAHLQRGERAFA
jgi:hypothetical protein